MRVRVLTARPAAGRPVPAQPAPFPHSNNGPHIDPMPERALVRVEWGTVTGTAV
jgi:hypothetical protein